MMILAVKTFYCTYLSTYDKVLYISTCVLSPPSGQGRWRRRPKVGDGGRGSGHLVRVSQRGEETTSGLWIADT